MSEAHVPAPTTDAPSSQWWRWLVLAALVLVLDQLSKRLVLQYFQWGDRMVVTDYFNLVRVHNEGAAFSFLSNQGGWQRWLFTLLGLSASVWMAWMIKTGQSRLLSFALAMIIGGALGNVIDRVAYGYVVDFLDFYWTGLDGWFVGGHFPAFNLADSAITLGAVLLIADELRRSRRARHNADESHQAP
jgi:signal peptidase II